MAAGGVAGRGGAGHPLGRARVSVVGAHRRAGPRRVAELARPDPSVAAGRRAVAVARGGAAGGTAAIARDAGGDRRVAAGPRTRFDRTRGEIERTGVSVVAGP